MLHGTYYLTCHPVIPSLNNRHYFSDDDGDEYDEEQVTGCSSEDALDACFSAGNKLHHHSSRRHFKRNSSDVSPVRTSKCIHVSRHKINALLIFPYIPMLYITFIGATFPPHEPIRGMSDESGSLEIKYIGWNAYLYYKFSYWRCILLQQCMIMIIRGNC